MQSGQQYTPQNLVPPFADKVGGGYNRNNSSMPSLFGGTIFPSGANPFTPFHNVDIQPSDVCPRNFIIFDQTDNRSQIMFHPAVAPKFCYHGLNLQAPCVQGNMKWNSGNEEREISNSSFLKENSDDIDALMSLEEEEDEEEEDEEEVSTARTYGNYGGDSPDSGPTRGLKPRKRTTSCSSEKSSGSCSEKKRMKMRKMVKTLRGIVPGGERMNTVDVLDEAVRYLKSLKVEVKKLGVGDININNQA